MSRNLSGKPPSFALPPHGPVPLASVLRTDELERRAPRPPNHEAERRLLARLAQALADSPRTILQAIAEAVMELSGAGSAGVSVLSADGKRFRWLAVAGAWKPYRGATEPRDFGPSGDVLDRNTALLFAHPERRYALWADHAPPLVEALVVPFHVNGRAVGVIWAGTHAGPDGAGERRFDAEDLRQLTALGACAAAAYRTRRLRNKLVGRDHERRIELAAAQRLQMVSGTTLAAAGAGDLYQELVDAAVGIMHSDMGSMQVYDESQDALRMLCWRGFEPEFGRIFGLNKSDTRTSCSVASQVGARVIVSDVETWDLLTGTPELEDHRRMGIRAVQSTPLFSRRGRLVGMISTHWRTPHTPTEAELRSLDILARQGAELIEGKRADEVTARLAAIVSSSDDAIVGKDLDGIVTSWNKGAERLFGYSADEMIGQPVALLIPAERLDEEPTILERIRQGERIDHYETVRRRKDGSLLDISITVSPVADATGRIIGAAKIARDITARKQAEHALVEADQRKNEFLAMLAHELRGPLAPVRNALQIVRMHGSNAEAVAQAAEMMERQVGQMSRLIEDLIDVSRISEGKLELRQEPTELASTMRGIAEAARPIYESMHQQLTVDLPTRAIYVHADRVRIAQVFGNLLHNASKFTDRGGRIGLAVTTEGPQVVVRVRDSGIGIAAADLSRIFDMFSQVDSSLERSRGGLGIGLSLVKRIVELHDGEVTAGSPGLGHGSEFVVRLPMLAAPDGPAVAEPSGATRVATGHRILVVDDNPDSVESLALLLSLGGHDVRTAGDGLAAVEAAAAFAPELVLLDLGLPKLNGYEAAQRIRSLPGGDRMKLVALSGWGQEEDRRRSEQAGFDLHLVKPVDPQALARLVGTLAG